MDAKMRILLKDLRVLGSKQAADFLMERCPAGSSESGTAMKAIGHLSWRRSDQIRLAEHYLARIPFGDHWPYESLAKTISIARLARTIEKFIPDADDKRSLLKYHMWSLYRQAKTDDDRVAVARLMAKI